MRVWYACRCDADALQRTFGKPERARSISEAELLQLYNGDPNTAALSVPLDCTEGPRILP